MRRNESANSGTFGRRLSGSLASGGWRQNSLTIKALAQQNAYLTERALEKQTEEDLLQSSPTSWSELFRFATRWEIAQLCLGLFMATLNGLFVPVGVIIYGEFTNLLIDRTVMVGTSTKTYTLEWFGGGRILNNGTFEENKQALIEDSRAFGIGCLVFSLGQFVVAAISVDLFNYAALKQIDRMKAKFLTAVLRQDMTWYDLNTSMNFATKVSDDVEKFREGIGEKVPMFFYLVMSFVTAIIISLCYGWLLTLVVLSTSPIIIASTAIVAMVQSSLATKELKAYSIAGVIAEEVLSSIRTVVAFGGEEKEIERYSTRLHPAKKTGIKKGMWSGIGSGVMWLIIYATYALSFWYGVKLIIHDRKEVNPTYNAGTLMIIFFSILQGAQNVGLTSPHMESMATARASAGSIYAVLDRKPVIDSLSTEGITPRLDGNLELKEVFFKYPARPDVTVLNGINLKINVNETVALVGHSGCGKSTVLQLLQRLYDPESGSVLASGNDLREMNVRHLRSHIAVVGQEPVLFAGTIKENIRMSNPSCTDEEVIVAAKQAYCHSFIKKLPDGYNTMIGERGAQLSGGQKQRIAIARALVRKPKILLLDEATSALDSHSEAKVQKALDAAAHGRTTVMVSHRLATVLNADRIVFIEKGEVIEQGTHEDLLAKKGRYYELVLQNDPTMAPQVISLVSDGTEKKRPKKSNDPQRLHFLSLKVHFCNIRGVHSNLNDVHQHLETEKPHLLFLTETQICDPSDSAYLNYPGYILESNFRSHAGVCMYASDVICCQRLRDLEVPDLSVMWVHIDTGLDQIVYAGVYRLHSGDRETTRLMEYLSDAADKVQQRFPSAQLVFLGDFNAHHEAKINRRRPKLQQMESIESISSDSMDEDEASEEGDNEDADKDKFNDPTTWEIMKMCKPEKWLMVAGVLAALAVGSSFPAFAILFGETYGLLESADASYVMAGANEIALLFLAVGVYTGIFIFLQIFIFNLTGVRLTARLRVAAFKHMLLQEIGWFDHPSNGIGALCARLAADAAAVQGATGTRIGALMQASATIGIGIMLSLYFTWKMTLISLISVPMVIGAVVLESRVLASGAESVRLASDRATTIATEAITNIKTVTAFCGEEGVIRRYEEAGMKAKATARRSLRWRGVVFAFGQTAPVAGYAISLWYGGIMVANQEVHYKNVIKVSEALIFGSLMMGQALAFAPNFSSAVRAAGRVLALMARNPKVRSTTSPSVSGNFVAKGKIDYEAIKFRYPTRREVEVLRGLSLAIPYGKTVALVGPSGCGKSTLIQLLQRLYDPDEGNVFLDDHSIHSDLRLSTLRKNLGIVSQEPVLFDRTIMENIAYGDNTRTVEIEEIVNAAKAANVHSFIAALPGGYNTRIGARASQLSGGQKQRIAIARALVRNPRVLLLDEATSALDTHSEKVVQEALDRASEGRTCLVIAHRLATIKNADVICVIDKGSVAEIGTHKELIRLKGIYARLYELQCGLTEEEIILSNETILRPESTTLSSDQHIVLSRLSEEPPDPRPDDADDTNESLRSRPGNSRTRWEDSGFTPPNSQ